MANSFSWQTTDGIEIYGHEWPVEGPKAVIAIVHGLGEHIHRYEHVAAWFNDRQIAVIGYDRRGHGRSGGKKGHAPRYSAFLDEVAQLLVEVELRYPEVPVFLYGHSMGGNLVLNYALRRHPTINGVIATAPHIRLSFQPNFLMLLLGRIMRFLFPAFTQSNGLDVDQLSRDREVVRKYQADPYVHDRLSAAAGIGLLEAAARLDAYAGPFPLPLLVMHGGADGITDPNASLEFTRRLQGTVEVKIWNGLFHEIHNEPEQEEILVYAHQWLTRHLVASPTT
ncbi:MAG: lysophospholipase [Lewinella sp.]|nr:lysophospholipase [Lewinella sp.]